jgi:hypothetical protein
MNYWVYFNQNPVLDYADLLIMDDAHLAEHCLHSLYSVEVSRHDHASLFQSLVTEIASRLPESSVLQDALAPSDSALTPPELISFIDQVHLANRIREIVDASPVIESDNDLSFRWRRMRNSLREANLYVGVNSIWIRPGIYPLISNPQYSDVTQCVYTSATIGDAADLSRQLGTRPIVKMGVPAQYAETTSGRRLVLMNRLEDEDIPPRLEGAILTAIRQHPKSVWLCVSGAEAQKYRDAVSTWLNQNGVVGHPTWILTSLGDEIDQFKSSPTGHLFVGGRFDGMNFEGDECRLVVLTSLPRAINLQEEFFCAYLRDAAFMKKRLNNRIIQALGRCNRSPEDFAMYVLCDKKFATHFGKDSNRVGIPRNIGTEIDLGEDLSETDDATLVDRVSAFLSADFTWYDATLRELGRGSVPTSVDDTTAISANDEVTAWTALFSSQNYNIAGDRFQACWDATLQANLIEVGAYYGWCWAKARYLADTQEGVDVAESLAILERAITRGGISGWFNRMRASLARARNTKSTTSFSSDEYSNAIIRGFDDLLESTNTRGLRFEKWCNQREEELNAEQHNHYRKGLSALGGLLGYACSEPKHGSSTDSLWRGVFNTRREVFTFELKIEHVAANRIDASDIGQAHNQISRARTEYGPLGYIVRGVILTHMTDLFPDAESAGMDIRILPKALVLELWARVRKLLTDYRNSWSLDDLGARRRAAEGLRPLLPPEGWLGNALSHDSRFVTREILFAEWEGS